MTDATVSFAKDFLAGGVAIAISKMEVATIEWVTWPMSSDTSPPRLLTWPSKANIKRSSWVAGTGGTSFGTILQEVWHQVVPLGPHPCVLCTLLILPVPVKQLMWIKLELKGNSEAS
ncbi:hypothetical protein P7K49_006183 [Saguinus oedipus]|uniref:Uncharacterized protein n=1 Tax=Saguinus oedipus TaxID=9490 RepID=A0ABQ9W1N2_SAGOE|nr:hypothetical protein P7K49_006183 [Saguinus oedipus]